MAINVRAPLLLTQALAKHMMECKIRGGSIVNISSVAAHGGAPFILAYSASKAALNCVTTNDAAELAPHGIRVNAINMGWTVKPICKHKPRGRIGLPRQIVVCL